MEKAAENRALSRETYLTIPPHAILKLRERIDPEAQHAKMTDSELRVLLEGAWREGIAEEWWETIDTTPIRQYVMPLPVFGGKLWSVVREDAYLAGQAVLVTILPDRLVQKNKNSRRWSRTLEGLNDKIGRAHV